MRELEPSDIYPALRRFLSTVDLRRTLKRFVAESGIGDDSAEAPRGKRAKLLSALDLLVACQLRCKTQKTLDPSDAYPAIKRFLADADLQRTLKSFAKEACLESGEKEIRKGKLGKRLQNLELVGACQSWCETHQGSNNKKSDLMESAEVANQVVAADAPNEIDSGIKTSEISRPKKRRKTSECEIDTQIITGCLSDDWASKEDSRCQEKASEQQNDAFALSKSSQKARVQEGRQKQPRDLLQVFVGGLPFNIDEATLMKDFSDCGTIAKLSLPLQDDGRARGIAFITFETQEGVNAALKYDGDEYLGRVLKVNRGGAFSPNGPQQKKDITVFVKGLPYDITQGAAESHFRECGELECLRMPKDEEGNLKGFAFITFTNKESCEKALEQNQSEQLGGWLTVRMAGDGTGKAHGGGKGAKSKGGHGKSKGGKRKGNGKG